ncbi:3-hydroxyisobutyrate dehydrogenase-like beta-hydroxyacid dehydrogenase [Rhizobium sp. BK529]|uniref:NAD(P)-dependent oxidoreductase n=1 Tax=Rhizobium sp. BK529 TaxID=2586983 RepID=UPI00161B9EBB|nr:NAD(P)-dependent oxidoreductase [Rhizobium sp. BK529]MBB3590953.1 3-hydroxyisobutyrate dehydrogenase-like beta-hydroxyacid dehydrogenase [Rhizobium sp. BK529]
MSTTIALFGAGAMGSAVGRRLAESGAEVITFLEGRSEATIERARAAGLVAVPLSAFAEADIILSIVPPAEAQKVADLVAPVLQESVKKPAFVDLNAISPKTMEALAAKLAPSGVRIIDGSIIGGPPVSGKAGPVICLSGELAGEPDLLCRFGLKIRPVKGPVGAASALKMCYAGINKGITGLSAAMLLAAARNGASEALKVELAESQAEHLQRLRHSIPDMYPKAYRWVAEMEEISEFLGADNPAALIFKGMAGVFQAIAEDRTESRELIATLDRMLENRH